MPAGAQAPEGGRAARQARPERHLARARGQRLIAVPEAFARATADREGAAGTAWLADLPGIVDDLLARWGCAPDGAVTHGAVGIIVAVRDRDGRAAMLKVSFPHPGNVHEPDAFAAWDGRGAVRLYERDDARFALLLERARAASLADVGDRDEVMTVAGRLARRLNVAAPPGLPRLRDRAGAWADGLRTDAAELAHALPSYVVDAAVATARELGADQPDTVVHGDLHPRNILRAEREPWLAVDPKGYAGDPAYDVGALLKACAAHLLGAGDPARAVHRMLDVFAAAAEIDRERTRRWAQLHAVQAAFWARRHGFQLARHGPGPDAVTAFADHLAQALTA